MRGWEWEKGFGEKRGVKGGGGKGGRRKNKGCSEARVQLVISDKNKFSGCLLVVFWNRVLRSTYLYQSSIKLEGLTPCWTFCLGRTSFFVASYIKCD